MTALGELATRWEHARRAALRTVVPEAPRDATHDELLVAALAVDAEAAAEAAFRNGLRLGAGFARFHGAEISLDTLGASLTALAAPCLTGSYAFDDDEPALRLEREGCPAARLGPAACAFWREAVDGLVLGLTGGIRHARHASIPTGAPRCVDVFYLDPESALRFGPVPDDVAPTLARAARLARAFNASARVSFLGLSEGVLYYEAHAGPEEGTVSVRSLVERTVQKRHPHLVLREASARAVLDP